MADPTVVRPQIAGLRRFYYVAVVLVTSVGVFTFVLSESTLGCSRGRSSHR